MPRRTKTQLRSVSLRGLPDTGEALLIGRDREAAMRDLRMESVFQPAGDDRGPYDLDLSLEENRLVFRIRNCDEQDMPMLVLSLKPYKRLIKDYFMIVDSYDKALRDGGPSKIEAIDVGRRGLHNEGAALLRERLERKIAMDAGTARRLFTLVCALHAGSARLLR